MQTTIVISNEFWFILGDTAEKTDRECIHEINLTPS